MQNYGTTSNPPVSRTRWVSFIGHYRPSTYYTPERLSIIESGKSSNSAHFRGHCGSLADDIASTAATSKCPPVCVVYHGYGDCNEGTEHVHVLWHHYRGSRITQSITKWVERNGYLGKYRDVWSPNGYRVYLRGGEGRHVLYEKEGEIADVRREEYGAYDLQPGTSRGGTQNNSMEDGTEPTTAGPSICSAPGNKKRLLEEQVGQHPRGPKPKKVPRTESIRLLVEKFKPETSLELIQSVQTSGSDFEKAFITHANTTHVFSYQLDAAMYADHLKTKFMPWMDCINSIHWPSYMKRRPGMLGVKESVGWICRFLDWNGLEKGQFITTLADVIDRKSPKKNAIWFHGEPNCGKSLILNSVAESCLYPARPDQPDPKEARFVYSCLATARVGLFNEMRVYSNVADKVLLLMEGADVVTDIKGKTGVNVQRTPLLITTNGELWDALPYREQVLKKGAIEARVIRYNLSTFPDLINCTSSFINTLAWKYMYDKYYMTYEHAIVNEIDFEFDENWLGLAVNQPKLLSNEEIDNFDLERENDQDVITLEPEVEDVIIPIDVSQPEWEEFLRPTSPATLMENACYLEDQIEADILAGPEYD